MKSKHPFENNPTDFAHSSRYIFVTAELPGNANTMIYAEGY